MIRRRIKQLIGEKPNPYEAAFSQVYFLRLRVLRQLPTAPFTTMDIIHWIWPKRVTDILVAAHETCDQYSFYTSLERQLRINMQDEKITIRVPFGTNGMCVPKEGLEDISTDHPYAQAILDRVKEISEIYTQFKKVETVITWFGQHATPGATRYYWPTMCSLLPVTHDIHKVESGAFRQPKENIAPMLPLIRETAGIVAGALLCPHKDVISVDVARIVIDGNSFDLCS